MNQKLEIGEEERMSKGENKVNKGEERMSKREEMNKGKLNTEEGKYRFMLKMIVTKQIHNLGMPAHIKGYEYVREAIMLVLEDRSNMECITKVLYPKIAKKFDTVATRVERAIRHAIEVTWDRGNIEVLNEIFEFTIRPDKGRPTNAEFIAMIVDKIRLYLEMCEDGDIDKI